MPRVTEEYRASRRAEIVAAASRLFATNGFHATSMADVIKESGLSFGAVYRYFSSKEDLIAAVAETALLTADEVFDALLAGGATPAPAQAVAALIETVIQRVAPDPQTGADTTRIAVQVWAEALRNPGLQARAESVYERLRGRCAEVVRRGQAAGDLPADVSADDMGAVMLSVLQGFILQRHLTAGAGLTVEGYLAGVSALLPASGKS